ncbi:unnamed protein product [Protopolystoma xenopodis]|uniref:C2 PI3K-type domain-containing protein n=1 Tax=Protopolystoma xenopodis TaxID=117903 RepID=A0A448XIJ3_9PLAT|nr:unnamed protein product [Protopolystoma xenopodis]
MLVTIFFNSLTALTSSQGGGPPVEIRNTHPKSGHELKWNQMLNFGLQYRHLPRSTRLCVALVKMRLTGKPDKRNCRAEERLAGWANLNLFDARGLLVRGQHILRLWPGSMILPDVDDRYNHLNPPGTTQLNPSLEASIKVSNNYCRY